MKLDLKSAIVLFVVVGFLVAGAYFLGASQPGVSDLVPPSAVAPSSNLSSSHPVLPATPQDASTDRKFSHFRVGNRNVKGMVADGDLVWVGTSGGVLRYDLTTDNYKLFDVSNGSLLSNGVFHLSILDKKIFVGTYGGGLSVYDPSAETWKNYNIPDGLADQFVYDVQRVANGDLWIATWSGANLVKNGELDNPKAWTTFNVENTRGGLPNDWVYGVEQGKDGDLWFATEQGLALYKDGVWKNWQHKDGLGAPLKLVESDIQFKNDPGKASRHHAQQKQEQGLGDVNVAYNPNYVVSLVVDRFGFVWAGTWGAGLARFDGEKWQNFTVKDGLPSNHVFMLYRDPDGQIWAGTSQGLAKVNPDGQSFGVYLRKDGLYADNVFSMAKASDGSFWVGSFGGVARLFGL